MRLSATNTGTLIVACVLLMTLPAIGRADLPPVQDADNAVFSATQVIVVSHVKDGTFAVQETLKGSLQPKQTVTLPGFKLATWGKMGDQHPVAMNERMRILLFLRPDTKHAGQWAITDYGYAFFYRDVSDVGQLRQLAGKALALRRQWEKAVAIADPTARLKALWPYVLNSGPTCHKLTMQQLAKLNPLPGDYLAEHLASYPSDTRADLMLLADRIPSDKLHAAALADVRQACRNFDAFLAARHWDHLNVTAHWNDGTLPESIKDTNGEVYYGLAGIHAFKDPKDLPFYRNLVPWLIRNGFDQSLEECVYMMRDFPAAANVPVLKTIWDYCQSRHFRGGIGYLLPIDVARALAATRGAEATPILKQMLGYPTYHDEALDALRALQKSP